MSTETELPPHNEQSEWMLLACLCEKPDILSEITQDLFYQQESLAVLRVINELKAADRPVDMFYVPLALQQQALFEPMRKLMESADALHSAWNYPYWLDILRDYRAARQAIALAARTESMVRNPGAGIRPDLMSLSSELQEISARSHTTAQPSGVGSILASVVEKLESHWDDPTKAYGIKTPFRALNKLTMGFKPGELIVIAARPAQGKSAIGLNIAVHAAIELSTPTLFFSLEMSKESLVERVLCSRCGFNMTKFAETEPDKKANDGQFKRFSAEVARLNNCKLQIRDDCSDIAEMMSAVSQSVTNHGTKLVVVDYLQRIRISGSKEGHYTQIGIISNRLKEMAMANKLPVIALAQLSREVEKEDRKPRLSDLRDSGVIEQDADIMAFIHQNPGAAVQDNVIPVELLISKHRNGPLGVVSLVFKQDILTFEDAPL